MCLIHIDCATIKFRIFNMVVQLQVKMHEMWTEKKGDRIKRIEPLCVGYNQFLVRLLSW